MRQLRIGEHSFRHPPLGAQRNVTAGSVAGYGWRNALASALFATDESDWSAPPQHSFVKVVADLLQFVNTPRRAFSDAKLPGSSRLLCRFCSVRRLITGWPSFAEYRTLSHI
jgi:hypothetical protein